MGFLEGKTFLVGAALCSVAENTGEECSEEGCEGCDDGIHVEVDVVGGDICGKCFCTLAGFFA